MDSGWTFCPMASSLLLRRERDREVAGALADARRPAQGAGAEALQRRALVGADGVDPQLVADELVVVLGVCHGGLELGGLLGLLRLGLLRLELLRLGRRLLGSGLLRARAAPLGRRPLGLLLGGLDGGGLLGLLRLGFDLLGLGSLPLLGISWLA